ncbi:MAG: RNA methyltransferase [Patescibacteria group bacterium]|nr:RNA methyltransferase [Patescibacteria group bacterium]
MDRITSMQNPRVKSAARLRDGRRRRAAGRILIDGVREIDRAVTAGVTIREVFFCPALSGTEAAMLIARLEATEAEMLEVTEGVFEKLAFGERADGVLAVAEAPTGELATLRLPAVPLVAVLEGIEKPGNVGAVLRSADGAGLDAVVVADPRSDLFNPNAIRASLGTVFSLPVRAATGPETLAWLRQQRLNVFAARVDGSVPYTEVDFRRPTALVLGSEAEGLTGLWNAEDVTAVRLPMLGLADSLNISVAAAVLFYEARRQRG